MKNSNIKKSKNRARPLFFIFIILLFVSLAILSFFYVQTKCEWLIWAIVAHLILLVASLISFAFVSWLRDIRGLMNAYKEKDDLIAGGLAYISTITLLVLLLFALSKVPFLTKGRELMQTLSSLLIAILPAFVGLLGVQFSIAIQERNRKQDLRLGAKPFFNVQCCKTEMILDEDKHTCHALRIKVKIKNISNNIGIPLKVVSRDSSNCVANLQYTPLENTAVLEEEVIVTSEQPYGPEVHIAIIYKDVYENFYQMEIEFLQYEKYHMSKTRVISDTLLLDRT